MDFHGCSHKKPYLTKKSRNQIEIKHCVVHPIQNNHLWVSMPKALWINNISKSKIRNQEGTNIYWEFFDRIAKAYKGVQGNKTMKLKTRVQASHKHNSASHSFRRRRSEDRRDSTDWVFASPIIITWRNSGKSPCCGWPALNRLIQTIYQLHSLCIRSDFEIVWWCYGMRPIVWPRSLMGVYYANRFVIVSIDIEY